LIRRENCWLTWAIGLGGSVTSNACVPGSIPGPATNFPLFLSQAYIWPLSQIETDVPQVVSNLGCLTVIVGQTLRSMSQSQTCWCPREGLFSWTTHVCYFIPFMLNIKVRNTYHLNIQKINR
jgi:hypothetical protein